MCFSKFKLCFDYEQKVLPDKIPGKWCEGRGEKLREFHNKTSELLNDSALHFTIKIQKFVKSRRFSNSSLQSTMCRAKPSLLTENKIS